MTTTRSRTFEEIFEWLNINCQNDIVQYITKLQIRIADLELDISTLSQEHTSMRARNERLEQENAKLEDIRNYYAKREGEFAVPYEEKDGSLTVTLPRNQMEAVVKAVDVALYHSEKPKQEPVAWINKNVFTEYTDVDISFKKDDFASVNIPLYTSPQYRELSDDEILELAKEHLTLHQEENIPSIYGVGIFVKAILERAKK